MTAAATQLEVAAQHLREAALIVRGKSYRQESYDLERVAFDCEKVAAAEVEKSK
jgi:ribosomal protein L22